MLRIVLALIGVVLAGCASGRDPGPARGTRDDKPPNVVIVFADDLGYGDLGCYGQTKWRTPNLDRLASGGVRLTNFYAAQAVCSASRAALLTGCYPNRIGLAGALGPRSRVGIGASETTIAEMCRGRGYATAIYGKWHLGDAPEMLPTRHGFDEWFGLPYSNDMWPLHPDLVKLPAESEQRKRGYPALPLYENERIVDSEVTAEDQKTLTKRYTERACEFIARNGERPFFLYVPHSMPHVPLFASAEFEGRSGAGLYGDVIEEIDWSVGRIVAELERRGLRERTLVIFASDNGPWLSYGDHAGTTGGLREGKGTVWEGGVRVPFIANWPGRLEAGKVLDEPAMTIDVLPTLASALGMPCGDVDGVDLWPLILSGDKTATQTRTLAFYYNANDLEAVRRGRWKLVLPHSYRTLATRAGSGGTPGAYKQVKSGMELYDLVADPFERHDLAAAHPEIVESMSREVERFREDMGDNLTGRQGANRREPGRVSDPVRP